MRHRTYLNVILTVNAALLAALVWVQIADQPILAGNAWAQRGPATMPNAAEQRLRMIHMLEQINKAMTDTRDLLKAGKARVEVTNLDTLKEGDADAEAAATDQGAPSRMEVRSSTDDQD